MIRNEKQGIHWLEFDLLKNVSRLTHGVFLRHGGFSKGVVNGLNMGFSVGDNPEHVQANIQAAAAALNLATIYSCKNSHGIGILDVPSETEPTSQVADALTCSTPQAGLLIKHADCQAAIFYDPIHHVVANVHSGWRGSVQNIYSKVIHHMQAKYHSKPEELLVGIGPSLGPQSAQFINYKTELPEAFWQFQIKPDYFDFWEISAWQLRNCGVLPHHIEIAKIDTYLSTEDCYSYRRDKPTGRHGTIVALL